MESHTNISYSCRPPPAISIDCFLWLYCTVQIPAPNLANLWRLYLSTKSHPPPPPQFFQSSKKFSIQGWPHWDGPDAPWTQWRSSPTNVWWARVVKIVKPYPLVQHYGSIGKIKIKYCISHLGLVQVQQ